MGDFSAAQCLDNCIPLHFHPNNVGSNHSILISRSKLIHSLFHSNKKFYFLFLSKHLMRCKKSFNWKVRIYRMKNRIFIQKPNQMYTMDFYFILLSDEEMMKKEKERKKNCVQALHFQTIIHGSIFLLCTNHEKEKSWMKNANHTLKVI